MTSRKPMKGRHHPANAPAESATPHGKGTGGRRQRMAEFAICEHRARHTPVSPRTILSWIPRIFASLFR